MTVYGITYTDANMTISAQRCAMSMVRQGLVDHAFIRTEKDISEDFINMNREIFAQPRGAGYWLWKPYIIYQELLRREDGDIIAYSDAGVEFIGPVQPLINHMTEDVFLFNNRWNHVDWCKWDVIDRILHWQRESLGLSSITQLHASNMFFRVSDASRRFVKEWLMWCQMPRLIDDSPSILPNVPTFQDHRHDQGVVASMAIRDRVALHWWPCVTNMDRMQEGDNYPAIFLHHRKRNDEYTFEEAKGYGL